MPSFSSGHSLLKYIVCLERNEEVAHSTLNNFLSNSLYILSYIRLCRCQGWVVGLSVVIYMFMARVGKGWFISSLNIVSEESMMFYKTSYSVYKRYGRKWKKTDCTVAYDGSWQKQYYWSKPVVFTITSLDTGKFLD